MKKDNYYKVFYKGEPIHTISSDIVKKQKIDDATLYEIKELHILFHVLVLKMQKERSESELKKMSKIFHKIQFLMQKKWGFKEDKNYHKFWELPKCSCPKLENYKNIGKNIEYKNPNCILHS